MATILERFTSRHYLSVGAEMEEAFWEVIPDGDTWELDFFRGNAGYDANTSVAVVWDYEGGSPTIVVNTHGELEQSLDGISFTGDGVKKLGLVLINNLPEAIVLGAEVKGRKVGP
jgi:hypothetical protein